VENKTIDQIIAKVDVPVEDPRFYPRVFFYLSRSRKKGRGLFQKIVSKEYVRLSKRVDDSQVQESCSVRNLFKSREIADALIDDEGDVRVERIAELVEDLKKCLYSLGPDRQYDAKRNEHMLAVLNTLKENKHFVRILKTIGKPHMHRYAEEVIRQTLVLDKKTILTDAHARKAALSAWLCYLRQNVGSCFATAPAIIIQTEQPATFLRDIQEMLATGRLKRTFGGVEYSVPLSYSWGAGDLRRVYLFQKGEYQENLSLWKSPGLIAALVKGGVIAPGLSMKEKEKKSRKIIVDVLKNWERGESWFYTSLESILKRALLIHLKLTEADINEYELRPKEMIHGGLLMTPSSRQASGGLGKRCVQFLKLFKEAKDAFKVFADNALLKTWEFTIASFAETKSQFTTWNLYTSLGLKPTDEGGIGPRLYEILKQRLDVCNEKVGELQFEYEQAYAYLQQVRQRLARASTEDEGRWLKGEYQARAHEFNTLEEMRNKYHNKARRYAHLYDGLIDLYFRLFPNYFQEIYDPDIIEVVAGPFDDSPAGFRLLYKHGRTNTSQWTRVTNHKEFIDALVSFFTVTENDLLNAPEMKGLEEDVGEIVTAIVAHVRSKEFLETAFWRMAKAHRSPLIRDPLENLDKIQKKPWVYTSGGALSTLVSSYFHLEQKPSEVSRWVENPAELLVFLIDAVKEIPENVLDAFIEDPEKRLLIHSPTHAFLLKPGYPKFVEGWKSRIFTYTWVRDEVVRPMEYFVDQIYVDADRMQFLTDQILQEVPKDFQHYFKQTFANLGGSMRIVDYRQHLLDTIALTRGLQYAGRGVLQAAQIDSCLYSLLPLFPSYQLKERVRTVILQLPALTKETEKNLLAILEDISGKIGTQRTMSARGLQNVIKAMLALVMSQTAAEFDYPLLVSRIAQKEGFSLPAPFLFADTNWVKDHFAFLVNPGNGKFELWRTDYTGTVGAPMSDWKAWLDGTKKHPDWGVYFRPHEYHLSTASQSRFGIGI